MQEQKWYYKWWTVIAALLTVGPFGFPLLWKSRDFNLFWKWLLTILFIVVTAFAVWASWKTVEFTIQRFRELGLL